MKQLIAKNGLSVPTVYCRRAHGLFFCHSENRITAQLGRSTETTDNNALFAIAGTMVVRESI
jgi:hypothetical protein